MDLNGSQYHFGSGYWTKIEVHKVKKDRNIPHGISYSLTLHDRNNNRVVGFDNAHAHKFKPKKKKYGARKFFWDHKHELEKVSPYEFESPGQLIDDFWKAVKKITKLK